ncbi:MAG: PDZ domain-containing protein [Synergistaceae bacterium]|jgi:hypothetical protein|nr:PDZ domain-containing protein [Synergistaceae bacterium]
MRLQIDKKKLGSALKGFGGSNAGDGGTTANVIVKLFRSGVPLAVLAGVLFALIACTVLEGTLAAGALSVQSRVAEAVAGRKVSAFALGGQPQQPRDIKFAAFNVGDGDALADKSEDVAEKPDDVRSIDAFQLVGTLPGVGAWLTVDNTTSLVLKEQEFNGYVLAEVKPGEVRLAREGGTYPLYLTFYAEGSQPQMALPVAQLTPPPPPPAENQGDGSVEMAEMNGAEGSITRERINTLAMNPLDELGKLRLVPTGDGMSIRNMRQDSIFNQLGVKRGDVITGVNGIALKDMSDMANVISSVLSGQRFDLQIKRGDQEGKLGYAVR